MSEKILSKIQKLLKHEQSARSIGSVAEASAFADKVQRLLIENSLSMTDVEMYESEHQPIETAVFPMSAADLEDWGMTLLGTIAGLNGCCVAGSDTVIAIIGCSNDRRMAESIFHVFYEVCKRSGSEFEAELDKPVLIGGTYGYSSTTMTFTTAVTFSFSSRSEKIRSYYHGLVWGICGSLVAAKNAAAANSRDGEGNIDQRLVCVDKRYQEAADELKRKSPDVTDMPRPTVSDRSSFEKGVSEGKAVANRKGLAGETL